MTQTADIMGTTNEDKVDQLVRARDAGLVPDRELLVSTRAKYLLGLREKLQGDQSIRAVVTASIPATDAFAFVEGKAWDLVREGTEDIYRDAIMFLLAELDELRKGGDQAYVVDTSTGEIVAPLTKDIIFYPEPYEDEKAIPDERTGEMTMQKVVVTPGPILDPKLASAMLMKAQSDAREADIRKKAEDPIKGRAYLHLTNPQRIAELAHQKMRESGLRLRLESEMEGCELELVEFGQEANEADLQATNPFFHRLWSYSAILASRVMVMAGTGGEYWMSEVHGNRDEEVRWYAVTVRVRRAG
jgi:hypothetical protein